MRACSAPRFKKVLHVHERRKEAHVAIGLIRDGREHNEVGG